MNLQEFADFFIPMTCIISVEKFSDGSYGNIRIVTGNQAYLHSTEAFRKVNAEDMYEEKFIPDMPYEYYIPKDLNFENFCYRCGILGEVMHSYVQPENFPFWIKLTMLPLKSDKENIGYCTYTQEFTKEADTSEMVNISPEISNEVLRTCIKLKGTKSFHETMNEIIHDIRDMCEADHCCILLADFNQRKCSVLCEALGKDTPLKSMKVYVNDDFFDIVATWSNTLAGSTCLIVNNAHDWAILKERNPIWYDSMYYAGAKNLIFFPLKAHGETLGYIWAINYNPNYAMHIMQTLELTTFFLASEISSYQLFEQMEHLSMTDMLTGIYNRNAMNHRVEELLSGDRTKNIGIVFADLNGLKHINDNEGHFAGDLLLKNAALTLQKYFPECEIYRAGGDEFMIIGLDISEKELLYRVQILQKLADKANSISFAVGCCMDTACNLRNSIHLADERMYLDKENFYQKHPEKKRN